MMGLFIILWIHLVFAATVCQIFEIRLIFSIHRFKQQTINFPKDQSIEPSVLLTKVIADNIFLPMNLFADYFIDNRFTKCRLIQIVKLYYNFKIIF